MAHIHEIETGRLLLRQWRSCDFPAFAQMNADEEVMRFFPARLSEQESNAMAQRCSDLIEQRGWGFWAVQERSSHSFIGFIGLHVPTADLPFSPCVEIGWRLARHSWGKGLATEGASAVLAFAFNELSLPEVVAFTTLSNERSVRVMKRLGMQKDELTFQHPSLPEGHPMREHCLYRASATSVAARRPPNA
ncbi:N-acetyltransferase [Aquabacterium soli]|uniref:N-acetyltransferase n=1 Tax=Aquabacterium soli TaxID=2493092 RepID=A0A426UZ89_9BURK|nr:GNAT family N-acetyltransferase [Aquabacterium soli]RRR99881.1 N-acetyltransferase [Aquabacterium soli]